MLRISSSHARRPAILVWAAVCQSVVSMTNISRASADAPAINVKGTVVTADGKPVRGASVVLRAKMGGQNYTTGLLHNRDVLAGAVTDADGRFEFKNVAISLRMTRIIESLIQNQGGAELVAWGDGYGLSWSEVAGLSANEPVRLVLTPAAAVNGIVRDKSGRGAAGVRVYVFDLAQSVDSADGIFARPGDLNLTLSEVAPAATTDADGRFTLPHLPAGYYIGAVLERAGLTRQVLRINTGKDEGITEIRPRRGGPALTIPVKIAPLNITLEPQRYAQVKVVDHNSQPVQGGYVELINQQRPSLNRSEVSNRGEANVPIPAAGQARLRYEVDPRQPRLCINQTVEVKEGDDIPEFTLRLPESRWLSGRVVDDTGKGIAGAIVSYTQPVKPGAPVANTACESGTDGSFKLPVHAGHGRLRVLPPLHGYFTPSLGAADRMAIDVPTTGEPAAVTLLVSRGLVIRGTVRDPAGKPVAGALVFSRTFAQPVYSAVTRTSADGRFELAGFSPQTGPFVGIASDTGTFRTTIEASEDHALDRPRIKDLDIPFVPAVAVTGRVLHKGKPRAGVVMKLFSDLGTTVGRFEIGAVKSNPNGSYRIGGLKAGDVYSLEVGDANGMDDPAWQHSRTRLNKVPVGQSELRLADLNLIGFNQTLRGTVVDSQGRPVAGAMVSAMLANGPPLRRRALDSPPSSTETDEQGRFTLRNLPDEPLQLITHRTPPGGRVGKPSIVRPEMNQQSIRIVFDPNLKDDVEDLDKKRPPVKKK